MKKILVIEDEPFIRESIRDVLELEGYQALTAANGSIGVQLAQKQLPDLILCDVSMPEMDGYEVLETLQQSQATNAIPFVFLTARTTKADLRQGMNLGADDYLAKPCTAMELLNAISSRFDKLSVMRTKSEEQLKSLRDNIAQSLPHELYTPLNGILGFSELLFRDAETLDQVEIEEIAEAIHTSALRLHHLMKNFLLYSKLELIAYSPEQIAQLQTQILPDPILLIQATAKQAATQMERLSDLQLLPNAGSTTPLITGVKISSIYLQKIVEELINNACKFSTPQTPITVQSSYQDQQLLLSISNQGRGMTAEQITSLGAYMQFDRKHYEQQGSGLGLIIAKRIVELHGGSLQITSIPNELTTIQVWLRLAD